MKHSILVHTATAEMPEQPIILWLYLKKTATQGIYCKRLSPHTLKWYVDVISAEEKATSAPWNKLPDAVPARAAVMQVR